MWLVEINHVISADVAVWGAVVLNRQQSHIGFIVAFHFIVLWGRAGEECQLMNEIWMS